MSKAPIVKRTKSPAAPFSMGKRPVKVNDKDQEEILKLIKMPPKALRKTTVEQAAPAEETKVEDPNETNNTTGDQPVQNIPLEENKEEVKNQETVD
jgi:hypothetical protein